MEIIFKPPQTGKTTEMIEKASKDNLYIVCFHRGECERVSEMAKKLGENINYPITIHDFIHGRFNPSGIKGFLIDNAEEIFKCLSLGVEVKAITMTDMTGHV